MLKNKLLMLTLIVVAMFGVASADDVYVGTDRDWFYDYVVSRYDSDYSDEELMELFDNAYEKNHVIWATNASYNATSDSVLLLPDSTYKITYKTNAYGDAIYSYDYFDTVYQFRFGEGKITYYEAKITPVLDSSTGYYYATNLPLSLYRYSPFYGFWFTNTDGLDFYNPTANIVQPTVSEFLQYKLVEDVDGDYVNTSCLIGGYDTYSFTYNMVSVNKWGVKSNSSYSISTNVDVGSAIGCVIDVPAVDIMANCSASAVNVYIDSVVVKCADSSNTSNYKYLMQTKDVYLVIGDDSLVDESYDDMFDSDSSVDDNLDDMWDDTTATPDVQILTEYISSTNLRDLEFFTLDNLDAFVLDCPEWATVYFGTNKASLDTNVIAVLDILKGVAGGDSVSVIQIVYEYLNCFAGLGDGFGYFVDFASNSYGSMMSDIVLFTYVHSTGEVSVFVGYTERYFIRESLYNDVIAMNSINTQLGEITSALVEQYTIQYNTYTYLKYRLDDINDNSIKYYISSLEKLDSLHSGITNLDYNISNYISSQTFALVSAIEDLSSNTFSVADSTVAQYLADIYSLIGSLGGDSSNGTLIELLTAILNTLDDGISINSDVSIGGGTAVNEIDTPQELGFTVWDTELDEVTSYIVNGMSTWYIDVINVINNQTSDNVFQDVRNWLELYEDNTTGVFDFFNPDLDLEVYDCE